MSIINPLDFSIIKPNHLSYGGLDRRIDLRNKKNCLECISEFENTRFVPSWNSKNLFFHTSDDKDLAPLPHFPKIKHFKSIYNLGTDHTFLGMRNIDNKDVAYIACDFSNLDEELVKKIFSPLGFFHNLREISSLIDSIDGSIMAYSRGIINWHIKNAFCPSCGNKIEPIKGGHERKCQNKKCNAIHFPRVDPAVIMLIYHKNRTLLGRQKIWPQGMYSTLAGFVEHGETIENAVAREVFEEVGIKIKNVTYHSSQPWPFPSSLMLGFFAEAKTFHISKNKEEIEDAQWFSKEELKHFGEKNKILPRKLSISRRLIDDWMSL